MRKHDLLSIVIVFVYFFAHLYIIWHINFGLALKSPYNSIVTIVISFFATISVISLLSSKIKTSVLTFLYRIGNSWIGVFAVTIICFLVNDLLNLFIKQEGFRHYSTIITLIADFVICIWSGINIGLFLRIKKVNIKVKDLGTDSFKIAFVADIHINEYTPFRKINKLVDKINSIKPDILLIGGDLSDRDINESYKLYGLDRLKAKYGIYAVTGNHEYHLGVRKFLALCEQLNIRVLRNESAEIANLINVVGINDEFGEQKGIDTSDLDKAFSQANHDLPVILLSHKPDPFKSAIIASAGMQLVQLSGHTHGGQIPPMGIIGSKFFKYYYGKRKKDNSIMYITSGAGWWGPPMRIFNLSEIVELTLNKE